MAILYVPAQAIDDHDLSVSLQLVKSVQQRGFPAGLMLVPAGGMQAFVGEARDRQLKNLDRHLAGRDDVHLIVMAPNLPLHELDLYHHPDVSLSNLTRVLDFAAGLRSNAIVTFHLNTLFTPEEWKAAGTTPDERHDHFEKLWRDAVSPQLAALAGQAGQRRVHVETTPVPEFGDRPAMADLSNPFPLYSGRGFAEVRAHGLGIALDLCHTFTLFKAASSFQGGQGFFDVYKGIFPQDLPRLRAGGLRAELGALESGDVVHLSDSRGLYDPGRNAFHQEGVALGEGEIEDLEHLVPSLLGRDLHVVFEVNETDYDGRPNLRRSLEYFWRHAG